MRIHPRIVRITPTISGPFDWMLRFFMELDKLTVIIDADGWHGA
jgi:hypothetical protein